MPKKSEENNLSNLDTYKGAWFNSHGAHAKMKVEPTTKINDQERECKKETVDKVDDQQDKLPESHQ